MDHREPRIKVRRAGAADLEAIVSFNAAMALETEDKVLDQPTLRAGVATVLREPERGFYLVAERESVIAGQLLITTEWSDWRNAYFWWIQSVYVRPDHRRRGVYRALNDHVAELARGQSGVCGVRLYVDRDNQPAQAVYRRLGMLPSHYDMYELEFDL